MKKKTISAAVVVAGTRASAGRAKIKGGKADLAFNIINCVFMGLVLLVILYPLYLVLIASVSGSGAVMRGEVWIVPKDFSLAGYQRIFSYTKLLRGYLNTIIYTVVGTSINLTFTLLAAYSLSKKDLVGRKFFTGMFLFTMFFSGGLIPTFLAIKDYNMLDSMWALILPGAVSVYNMILCRTFFECSIPPDLWESAQLDGCSHFRFFRSIVLSLSKSIISVMILYYAVAHWNSYFDALIYINDQSKFPLQIILRDILLVNSVDSEVMAGSNAVDEMYQIMLTMKYGVIIVSSAPIIVLYMLVQKHFEKGVMLGAIKG